MREFLRGIVLLSALLSATIGALGQPALDISLKHVSCFKGADAEISIELKSWGGNVIVQWENPSTMETDIIVVTEPMSQIVFPMNGKNQTPISAGEIVLTVIEVQSANSIAPTKHRFIISEPENVSYKSSSPAAGGKDGRIEFTTPTSQDLFKYQYSVDGGITFQNSPVFEQLTEGEYHVQVRVTSSATTCFIDEVVLL